jgi:hypothetical protein
MAAQGIVLGIPPAILNLVQNGLLERAFHDALVPLFLYRQEALFEEWVANVGTQVVMTRAGLLAPNITPQVPGTDPVPQTLTYEQWVVTMQRWTGSIDTHMPTSVTSMADQFMRNLQQLGLQAAQSINRVSRNSLFVPYLSGNTASTVAGLTADTQIQVASVNGFTTVVQPGSTVAPVAVSAANPLAITIPLEMSGTVLTNTVIGYVLNNPNDPNSPGVLLLGAELGAAVPQRTPVLSAVAPAIVRAGGGLSVDAISAADTFTLSDINNAVAVLRGNNVFPHEDGWYHGHLPSNMNAEIFNDPAWQKLNTALPDHPNYKQGWLNPALGVMFLMNNESPTLQTTSGQVNDSAGQSSVYAFDIGGEIVNASGVPINRTLITGKGALIERGFDEMQYISEAGMTGKVGEFDVNNQGINVSTDRFRLYIRSPLDRLGDVVSSTYSITTSFAAPTDITATSSSARYKRAVVIESA